ncbi:MAG: acyl-CoA reductase [Flavobacteriaceae bacterium]|nr:acyl-CoA reductase [Flavobacteriaceae bacterium]
MSEKAKKAFIRLGENLRRIIKSPEQTELQNLLELTYRHNSWFTTENSLYALRHWANLLEETAIENCLQKYAPFSETDQTVGIVMAGNLPLVGFHDLLCVLLAGYRANVKLSSKDSVLTGFMIRQLIEIEPSLADKISLTEGILKDFDLVIATGSNNTARYFEYYFKNKPHIIRKNRSSIAVLDESESEEALTGLCEDIFRYFGLGCRNVSKLYVPEDYDFDMFFKASDAYKTLIDHHKYNNNYNYHKALYLMNQDTFLDNDLLLLKASASLSSPLGVVFFENYTDKNILSAQLQNQSSQLQCVVSKNFWKGEVPFGQTQKPALHEYADGVDTLAFLSKYHK